jgi:hypothetical protein
MLLASRTVDNRDPHLASWWGKRLAGPRSVRGLWRSKPIETKTVTPVGEVGRNTPPSTAVTGPKNVPCNKERHEDLVFDRFRRWYPAEDLPGVLRGPQPCWLRSHRKGMTAWAQKAAAREEIRAFELQMKKVLLADG